MNSKDKRNSVKKDYDLIAKQYSEEFGNFIEDLDIYEEFEKYLSNDATVLDLGAGSGRTYSYFNKRGYNYIALDFSKEMKKYAFKLHGEFPYIVDDIVNIKNHFKNESIDAIFAIYSLFHLPKGDFEKAIKDIYEILKNNGVLLISYSEGNGEEFVDEPYLEEQGKGILYMNYMNRKKVNDLLNENKFDILFETSKHETGDNVIGENGNDAVYVIAKKRS